ncbi:MAG: glutamate mutase L [Bacillota bacterium]
MRLKVDVLVAEVGSTTTTVNAFLLGESARFLGQGVSPTTVDQGDVTIGLRQAVEDLAHNLGARDIESARTMAASSAAGGLSMSVHGLVLDMTARAAKEAALGAGAVVRMVTAGDLTELDIQELARIKPKMILLAGGVDHGEKATVIKNAKFLADYLEKNKPEDGDVFRPPVVYAGNVAARKEVAAALVGKGVRVYFVDNVFPRVDELVVEPARKVIQDVFEEHITRAPGMDDIRRMVDGPIMPTPGAVMEACRLLRPILGEICAVDVGGATTDVHSVAKGSPEIQDILESPEPLAKRTVEGDLGIYFNAKNVLLEAGERAERDLGFDPKPRLESLEIFPREKTQIALASYLTRVAAEVAFSRHVGRFRYLYGPSGRQTLASGKDLTSVKTIIGTGGPLTRLPGGRDTLAQLVGRGPGRELYPKDARVVLDSEYVMAACGVLSREYPKEAALILLRSLGLELTS